MGKKSDEIDYIKRKYTAYDFKIGDECWACLNEYKYKEQFDLNMRYPDPVYGILLGYKDSDHPVLFAPYRLSSKEKVVARSKVKLCKDFYLAKTYDEVVVFCRRRTENIIKRYNKKIDELKKRQRGVEKGEMIKQPWYLEAKNGGNNNSVNDD